MSSVMIEAFRSLGRADALALRNEAASLTGTQIIDREHAVPAFDPQRDYSGYPVGAPVADEGQVWLLILPHDAAHYPDARPATNRACWGLAHTTNPARAKPWVDAYGISGLYMTDECYKAADGTVYRALQDDLTYDADALPDAWDTVEVIV